MARQSRSQKDTIERVMHAFKEGELEQKGGRSMTKQELEQALAR